jgi:hypothetical protein
MTTRSVQAFSLARFNRCASNAFHTGIADLPWLRVCCVSLNLKHLLMALKKVPISLLIKQPYWQATYLPLQAPEVVQQEDPK